MVSGSNHDVFINYDVYEACYIMTSLRSKNHQFKYHEFHFAPSRGAFYEDNQA